MATDLADRPSKRARLLSDDEDSGSESPGVQEQLTVNDAFAKRYEHNQKRKELEQLQAKYGKDEDEAEEESSDGESEDDAAELMTHELDGEILSTLKALRSKDPRIYDKQSVFYQTPAAETSASSAGGVAKKSKPVTLQDYHRQNLLDGYTGPADDEVDAESAAKPMTYHEEQQALKRDLVQQMHNAQEEQDDENEEEEDEDFLVRKSGPKVVQPKEAVAIDEDDIANADKDPEAYLDRFMQSRAWERNDSSRLQPFDSDDSEDEDRADDFEQAYNMRFEDPERSNEKLLTHSRQTANKFSVRRDELSGRQRARQREREQKDAVKRQRDEDKQRLRKLKLDAAQEKLNKFKDVAGLKGKNISDEAWEKFMNADWDDANWEKEVARHFDDAYYAAQDGRNDGDGNASSTKPKKPKWDDDIDIGDIVPDFDDGEAREAAKYTLTDDEDEGDSEADGGVPLSNGATDADNELPASSTKSEKRKGKKIAEDRVREQKRQARQEKMRLEELVSKSLAADDAVLEDSKGGGAFRYRDTSPGAFGLSATEILMADDAQLNEFAGLKKLAAYRDEEKKARDRKKLGKKDRLRKWRKETFGDRDGPRQTFQEFLAERMAGETQPPSQRTRTSNIIERDGSGKRKKKQRGGKKRKASEQST